ncbi:MAG: sigma 54-interacting transcriptional regulator, partial [Pseudomonadota bacterium]
RKGAFTDARENRVGRFELAGGGTLFMDEIANIPATQQPKLLRVLESNEFERVGDSRSRRFEGRLISATNAALDETVANGEFRQDLLFRLNTVTLEIPPLRDRPDDLRPLADQILERLATRYGRRCQLSDEAVSTLRGYAWPGNVRELSHVLERAVILCDGDTVEASDLNLERSQAGPTVTGRLDDIERQAIEGALARFDGNVAEAAEALGISRSACYRRMEKFGL